MFGTNMQYDLERLPFTAYGAFLSVYQNISDQKFYLSLPRGNLSTVDRPALVALDFIRDGESVPFTYTCTPSKLTVNTKPGTVEFAYEEDPSVLRVRADGVTLRLSYKPGIHEPGCITPEGDIEFGFRKEGKLKLIRIAGKMETDINWNYRQVCPYPFKVDIIPDGGPAEAAVHEYVSTCPHRDSYADFDAVAEAKQKEFDKFTENYSEVPDFCEDMAEKAKYMIWHSYLGPRGTLKEPVVYMHKLFINRAFGWQQAFHAMAMRNNVREAWRLLLSFFEYQNEIGGIPDHLNDIGLITYMTTKPPIQGYAVEYILDRFDVSELAEDDYRTMLDRLSKFTEWWFVYHDHAKTGYPAYYHPDESGYDESSAFDEGLPLISPDLLSYIVFNCEACARLCRILGDEEKASYWTEKAAYVLDYLVNTLWDGEQFRAYLPAKKKFYKNYSVTQMQPLMLGKRLPEDIVKVIVGRLTDPEQFNTDYGFTTENLQSDKVVMRAFTRGTTIAPTQFFLINGLRDAGYGKEARKQCVKYLNALNHKGLALGIHSFRVEPVRGNTILQETTARSVGFPFSSWVGSIYLALAESLAEQEI